jgi:RimJ/RimL family protein N-acetyltransferase
MASPLLEDVPDAIETERLLIRCPRAGDGQAVFEAVLETFDQLHLWMPWARTPPAVDDSEAHCRRAHANFMARTDLPFALFLKRTWQYVGGSGLHRMDWDVRRFEIGYWCRKSMQGQGLITEAVQAISNMAFDKLAANRVEIHCSHRNVRSQKVAELAGFPLEARLKNHALEPNGELRDTLIYAKTR